MWSKVTIVGLGLFGFMQVSAARFSTITEDTDQCEIFKQLNGDKVPPECESVSTRSFIPNRTASSKPKGGVALKLQFDFNSTTVSPADTGKLKKLAGVIKSPVSEGNLYLVEGNTDTVGSVKQNDLISKRRAEAVCQFLISQGAQPKRLVAVGNGFRNLADPRDPRSAENRRVEVINAGMQ
jgi:outer membrane protein OmpA-like peptidoglycan-associated protein